MALLRDKFNLCLFALTLLIAGALALFKPNPVQDSQIAQEPNTQFSNNPDRQKESIQEPQAEKPKCRVLRVVDGDTLKMESGETIRLVGVDTPESKHPELPVQRFGEEATAFLKNLVEGREVKLESQGKDKYGRTLAYVFVGETLVNAEIIRRGYGYAYTRFTHSKLDEFIQLEKTARKNQYGLWNYSLSDGRIANLINRYEILTPEGKKEFDSLLEDLLKTKSQEAEHD